MTQYLANVNAEQALDRLRSLGQYDTMQDCQKFYGGPARDLPGEKKLCIAILMDAWACLEGSRTMGAGARTPNFREKLFDDTARWAMSTVTDYLHSFENVCDIMGLDAGAVREHWIKQYGIDGSKPQGPAKVFRFGRPRRIEVPDWLEYGFDHKYISTMHCQDCKTRYERTVRKIPPDKWKPRNKVHKSRKVVLLNDENCL